MIILPTEKRFRWNNPPFVLCLLIFLNVVIYFFYQSGDDNKFDESIGLYLDAGLLEKEWDVYQEYLGANGKKELLEEMREAHKDQQVDYLAYMILSDQAFAKKIALQARNLYSEDDFESLLELRQKAAGILLSTSSLRFGLIPMDIGIVNLFSSQFLHGDFMHLLGNMFFLVICGFAVEAAIGHLRFLLFYLLSGLAGGLAHAALDLQSTQPLIGASGAISGVMAMYLWIFRLKKIEFFYWFYVFVGYVRLPALAILPLYIGQEIVQYFLNPDSNVAFMAHAGGFAAASLLMAILLWWKPHTLDEGYIEEDHSIDPYRLKLSGVYQAMETGQFPLAQKRLQELVSEYQETFPLCLLQYHLAKGCRDKNLQKLVKKLLTYSKLDTAELRRQERVWMENEDCHLLFSEDELVRIGMRFSALDDLLTAERIFTILTEKGSRNDMMGVFARKLAVNFERLLNRKKSNRYSALADAYLNGGQA